MESRKIMVLMNLFSGQQWRNRHREQTYGAQADGRRERVRCMERVTWTFELPYIKWIVNGNFLYGSRNLNRGSVSIYTGEIGGRFKREGIYVYPWLIHVEV